MDTANVTNTSSTSGAAATSTASNTLDKNAFLKLLVAELQNQDPTNANQDPNQMVQQMASFSALEAQQNTNSLLQNIQQQNAAIYEAQSANLIGKKVQITSNTFSLSGGTANIGVTMPQAGIALLTVKNSSGQVVATIGPGSVDAGNNAITWNGKDANGNQLPDGTYTVSVSAVSATGSSLSATTTTTATVTALSFASDGTVTVTAGGNQYPLSTINQISS